MYSKDSRLAGMGFCIHTSSILIIIHLLIITISCLQWSLFLSNYILDKYTLQVLHTIFYLGFLVSMMIFNPNEAESTYIQAKIFHNYIKPVMMAFIGKLYEMSTNVTGFLSFFNFFQIILFCPN